jgi:hypothetical protein
MYYNKCVKAAEDVGTVLKMDLDGHKEFEAWITRLQSGAR